GDTNVSIISSILKDTPAPVTDLNPRLPAELGKIVRRTLAKDPSRRYQTAVDLRNELEELKLEVDSGLTTSVGRPPASTPTIRRYPLKVFIALASLAALLIAVGVYRFGFTSKRPIQFEADRLTRLTTTGNALTAAVSGDGRYVVHVKVDKLQPSLWVRQTATLSDVEIVPGARVRYKGVSFSPDGNYVYYVTYDLGGEV